MAFNKKSLANLKPFRVDTTDVLPDSTQILPVVETARESFAGQCVARQRAVQMAVDAAPAVLGTLIRVANGAGRGIPWPVRRAAAVDVLTVAGVIGTSVQQSRTPVDGLCSMSAAELSAFVDAGRRALQLRADRASAEDAEIIQS